MNVEEFLRSKGFDPVRVGDNWNINCPFCDDTRNRLGFHIRTGQYNCLNGSCDVKGKQIKSFLKRIGESSSTDLDFKPTAKLKPTKIRQDLAAKYNAKLDAAGRASLDYLMKTRGFSRKSIDHFQLGSWKDNGREYASVPYWRAGRLVNIKFRALQFTDKKYKWRRIKGGESSLFNDDVLDDKKYDSVVISEAEFGAVSLHSNGIKNVVGVTVGAKAFKQEWYERLQRFKKIYLVYDNDTAGQAGAEKMAKRLGFDRCFNVLLPKSDSVKDINEYFWDAEAKKQNFGIEDFNKLLKDARKFEVKGTVSLRDAMKDLHKDRFTSDADEVIGFQTPWKKVNKVLRGSKPGELVVVTGKSKSGKSTFVLNWMLGLAQQDITSYMFQCEMKPKRMAEKYVAMHARDFTIPEEMTRVQLAEANYALPTDRIYFGHPQNDVLELDEICDRFKEAVQRYGARFLIFDNLHFLVRGDNIKDRIGEVTRRFKLLAEALGVVFVLVVHPKKVGDKMVTPDDLKDSSSIYQDLDTLMIVHRDRKRGTEDDDDSTGIGQYDALTEIHISGRWIEGGRASLYYDGNRAKFYDDGSMYRNALKIRTAERDRKKKQFRDKGRKVAA